MKKKTSRKWKFIGTLLFGFRCQKGCQYLQQANCKSYYDKVYTIHGTYRYQYFSIFSENVLLCISRWGLLSFILDIDVAESGKRRGELEMKKKVK